MRMQIPLQALYYCMCVLGCIASIAYAAFDQQWQALYDDAFVILEHSNPAEHRQEIAGYTADLKKQALLTNAADLLKRSQDPADALSAYDLLQQQQPDIKEVKRRVKWYRVQKRPRLADYIEGLLKGTYPRAPTFQIPTVVVPTLPETLPVPIIEQPAEEAEVTSQKASTPTRVPQEVVEQSSPPKVRVPVKPVVHISPESASLPLPRTPKSTVQPAETTQASPEPVQPVVKQESAKEKEQKKLQEQARQLRPKLSQVGGNIANVARNTPTHERRMMPRSYQDNVETAMTSLQKNQLTVADIRQAQAVLAHAERLLAIMTGLTKWEQLADDDYDSFVALASTQANSARSVPAVIGTLQRTINEMLVQDEPEKQGVQNVEESPKPHSTEQPLPSKMAGADAQLARSQKETEKARRDYEKVAEKAQQIVEQRQQEREKLEKKLEDIERGQVAALAAALLEEGERQRRQQETEAVKDQIKAAENANKEYQKAAAKAQAITQEVADKKAQLERELKDIDAKLAADLAAAFSEEDERQRKRREIAAEREAVEEKIKAAEDARNEYKQAAMRAQQISEHVEQEKEKLKKALEDIEQEKIAALGAAALEESMRQQQKDVIEKEPAFAEPPLPGAPKHGIPQTKEEQYEELAQHALEAVEAHPPIIKQQEPPKQPVPEPIAAQSFDDTVLKLRSQVAELKAIIDADRAAAPTQAATYQAYLTALSESLEPWKLPTKKDALQKFYETQKKAYTHVATFIQALKTQKEFERFTPQNIIDAYNLIATKTQSIPDLDPYAQGYKNNFVPEAIQAIVDDVYYKPIRLALTSRLEGLQKTLEEARKKESSPAYKAKLQELITQTGTLAIDPKEPTKSNKRIDEFAIASGNLIKLINAARNDRDWGFSGVKPERLYKEIITLAGSYKNYKKALLNDSEAQSIAAQKLQAIRAETLTAAIKAAIDKIDKEKRKVIDLDRIIETSIAEAVTNDKAVISNNEVIGAIHTALTVLADAQPRLSTDALLKETLALLSPEERGALHSASEAALKAVIAEHNAKINTLFNALSKQEDYGLRYFLVSLLITAENNDDALRQQQTLITQENTQKAIDQLDDYSQSKGPKRMALDAISGALLLDWNKYWNAHGGIRRVMTQQEVKQLLVSQGQALQQAHKITLLEQAQAIDQTLLNKSNKSRLNAMIKDLQPEVVVSDEDLVSMQAEILKIEENAKTLLQQFIDGIVAEVGRKLDGGFENDEEQSTARKYIATLLDEARKQKPPLDYIIAGFKKELIDATVTYLEAEEPEEGWYSGKT